MKSFEIKGLFSPYEYYPVEKIPQLKDEKTGRIVCPVIRKPEHLFNADHNEFIVSNVDFWFDEFIKSGSIRVVIYKVQ